VEYLGHLAENDPLRHFLGTEIMPQLGCYVTNPDFRVFRLGERRGTCLYQERGAGMRVVGKFFAPPYQPGTPASQRQMDREYDNLQRLHDYGLSGYPHHVVRALGRNAALSSVLVEEYVADPRLSECLEAAARHGQREALFARLTALAFFLARLHNRTANGLGVDFSADGRYLDRLVGHLLQKQALCAEEAQEFYWLRDRWVEQPRMWQDQQVLVHGDATPANFLMGSGLQVTAIDLERMKYADRVFDIGRIAGELQHTFLQATGAAQAAEPFIGHFLWEYACHFPDRHSAFRAICGRVPFQMALTLLRIARNDWISRQHRQRLLAQARTTLRSV